MTLEAEKGPESGLWKNYLNRRSVTKMAEEIGRAFKGFDQSSFVDAVIDGDFGRLELKQRIFKIADVLYRFLPKDYSRVTGQFGKIAPRLGGFENWALMAYIEQYGLDHFEQSVAVMEELTQYSTAEFAIRPYMVRYEKQMLKILNVWATDDNEHVRRLAAEGSRPRGVWTIHLESFKKNPAPVLSLLEKLKADPSLYVRKAVANNLNDISKNHPDEVIKKALAWKKDGNKHTDWIVKHACRSLIKKGNPRVFPIFGFTSAPKIELKKFTLTPKKPKIGSVVSISFNMVSQSSREQKLAIDYRVHYRKKDGRQSSKVFKLAEKALAARSTLNIATRHSFEDRSTRKHYQGRHRLELIINGKPMHEIEFNLVD